MKSPFSRNGQNTLPGVHHNRSGRNSIACVEGSALSRASPAMNIHEYQAKELLEKFGVATTRGKVASSPDQAEQIARELGDRPKSW